MQTPNHGVELADGAGVSRGVSGRRLWWLALRPEPWPDPDDPVWRTLAWAGLRLTPHVGLRPPAVLLEVVASLHLWGGPDGVLRALRAGLPANLAWAWADGPTSWVAWVRLLTAQPHTPAAQLPLAALPALAPHAAWLHALGWRTWADLDAQPRAALARRLGVVALDQLDQALGRCPEVVRWLTLPERFSASLDLPAPAHQASALLFGAHRLLQQLAAWLRARQRGALAVALHARCEARPPRPPDPVWTVRSTQPAQDPAHLQTLLAEQLARSPLPAPVAALRLTLLASVPWQAPSASLLRTDPAPDATWTALVERLSARLGAAHVRCVQAHSDHRPEQRQHWGAALGGGVQGTLSASINEAASAGSTCTNKQKRVKAQRQPQGDDASWPTPLEPDRHRADALAPTWLLDRPLALADRAGVPWLDGAALGLLSGPQRIESGWWDACADAPVLRDYYVAAHPDGRLLWVYRQRLPTQAGGWFWHGVYG